MVQEYDRGLVYADLLRLRRLYKDFRETHWSKEKNHIKPEYAEEFYKIFREGVMVRRKYDECLRRLESQKPRAIQGMLNF